MQFLTPGRKIQNIRNLLGLSQDELEIDEINSSYINMAENDRLNTSAENSAKIVGIFNKAAVKNNIQLDITADKLLKPPVKEAEEYCIGKLSNVISFDTVDEVICIAKEYNLSSVLAKAITVRGDLLYDNREYINAFTYYFQALETYRSMNDIGNTAFLYNKLGKCKIKTLEYGEALVHRNKAFQHATTACLTSFLRITLVVDMFIRIWRCYLYNEKNKAAV